MERTDEDIAASCAGGALHDFDLLYERYARPIYAFASRRLLDRGAAEDVTSVVFLKAIESIRSFNPRKAGFRTWLYQIARNAVIDHVRSQSHRATDDIESAWEIPGADRADDRVKAALRDEKLRSALAELSPLQREIVFLRIWEDLSYAEIAALTGKNEGHCKVLFSRTMKELRSALPLLSFLLLLFSPLRP